MSDDLSRRFDRLEALPVPRDDLGAVVARGHVVRRAQWTKAVGMTVILLLGFGFLATKVDLHDPPPLLPSDGSRYTDDTHGYSAELPGGWFGFSPTGGGDPRPMGTFATFPVDEARYGTTCGPDFEGLTYVEPKDVVVTISERYYSPETGGRIEREFDPRAADIGPDDAVLFPYGRDFYKKGCPDTENEWWQTSFHDNGRGFYVTIQFGSAVPTAGREEVWEFLDSFTFKQRNGFPEDFDYAYYEDAESRFSVVYPKVWERAESSMTPDLADPVELFSIGSFPLQYRRTDCANMPKSAFEDMGTSDVFISVQESSSSGGDKEGFEKRPRSFNGSKPFALECVPETLTSYWIPFKDAGRSFYALAVFGPDASPGMKDEAWGVLDSFEPK